MSVDDRAVELASLKAAFMTPSSLEAKEETVLGLSGSDGQRLAFSEGGTVKAMREDSVVARVLGEARAGKVGLAPMQAPVGPAQVVAFGPVKGTDWGLAMVADETQLYAPLYRGLFQDSVTLVGGLAMLTSLAGVGVHLVTGRPIVGFLREKDARLADKNRALTRELELRVKAEVELKQVNAHLEALVGERTAALSASNASLVDELTRRAALETGLRDALSRSEVATRAKSELLANVSHELRTPLTAILGFSDIITTAKSANDDLRDTAGSIKKNAESLVRLVEDLLDLGASDAGQGYSVRRERVEMAPLWRDLEGTFERAAHARGITLITHLAADVPAVVESDPLRLKQVLSNLLGNALKFTAAGGTVTVTCEARKPGLAFRVSDTGIGIATEQHALVFEPFYQVDSSLTRAQSGAGRGLTLARQLARALGGDVVLAVSTPGKGSEFVATIGAKPAEAPPANPGGQRWLALVADEQPPSP